MGDLDAAVLAAQQFSWGGMEPTRVVALAGRLQAARTFASAVNAAIKTKPSLEGLQSLLNQDPPPLPHPGEILAWQSFHVRQVTACHPTAFSTT